MLERVDHLLILLWEQSLPHTIYITVAAFLRSYEHHVWKGLRVCQRLQHVFFRNLKVEDSSSYTKNAT